MAERKTIKEVKELIKGKGEGESLEVTVEGIALGPTKKNREWKIQADHYEFYIQDGTGILLSFLDAERDTTILCGRRVSINASADGKIPIEASGKVYNYDGQPMMNVESVKILDYQF